MKRGSSVLIHEELQDHNEQNQVHMVWAMSSKFDAIFILTGKVALQNCSQLGHVHELEH
jgi:hypothetical protein